MNACRCGCGGMTRWQFIRGHYQRTVRRQRGYRQVVCPDRGIIEEHVAIAESVLGHRLPDGAEIHHVDGNRLNNSRGNLVICQDRSYHRLLHARAKVVRAGGNPNTEKICTLCRAVKPLVDFGRCSANGANGRQGSCRACMKIADSLRHTARRLADRKAKAENLARHL